MQILTNNLKIEIGLIQESYAYSFVINEFFEIAETVKIMIREEKKYRNVIFRFYKHSLLQEYSSNYGNKLYLFFI